MKILSYNRYEGHKEQGKVESIEKSYCSREGGPGLFSGDQNAGY